MATRSGMGDIAKRLSPKWPAAGFMDIAFRCSSLNRRAYMQRRTFSREYKLEVVKLVKERGGPVAQASRDLDVHENVLRK